nr:hypothetical protein [uncultured Kingella sp.]
MPNWDNRRSGSLKHGNSTVRAVLFCRMNPFQAALPHFSSARS